MLCDVRAPWRNVGREFVLAGIVTRLLLRMEQNLHHGSSVNEDDPVATDPTKAPPFATYELLSKTKLNMKTEVSAAVPSEDNSEETDLKQPKEFDEYADYTELLTARRDDVLLKTQVSREVGTKPWFYGTLGKDSVQRLLDRRHPGTFLVAFLDGKKSLFLFVVISSRTVYDYALQRTPKGTWVFVEKEFNSITEALRYYIHNPLPVGVNLVVPMSKFRSDPAMMSKLRSSLPARGSLRRSASEAIPPHSDDQGAEPLHDQDSMYNNSPQNSLTRSNSYSAVVSNSSVIEGDEFGIFCKVAQGSIRQRSSLSWDPSASESMGCEQSPPTASGHASRSISDSSSNSMEEVDSAGERSYTRQNSSSSTSSTSSQRSCYAWPMENCIGSEAISQGLFHFRIVHGRVSSIDVGKPISSPGNVTVCGDTSTLEIDLASEQLYNMQPPLPDCSVNIPRKIRQWDAVDVSRYLVISDLTAFYSVIWANKISGPVLVMLSGKMFLPCISPTEQNRFDRYVQKLRALFAQEMDLYVNPAWWAGSMDKRVCEHHVLTGPHGGFLVREGSKPGTVVIVANDFGRISAMQVYVNEDGSVYPAGGTQLRAKSLERFIFRLSSQFQYSKVQASSLYILLGPAIEDASVRIFSHKEFDRKQQLASQGAASVS